MLSSFVRFNLLTLLAAVLAANGATAQDAVRIPADRGNFHLFLLAGQSNMAGCGKVEEQDREPHPRILMLDKDDSWVPATDPLHFDKPGVAGVGLGRTFALDYAEQHPEITVGLVPCAVGGSPIAACEPGGYHNQLSFTLDRGVAHRGFDGKTCWVHARAGAIPSNTAGNAADKPQVVMTTQQLLLTGSDVFYALHGTRSTDGGDSWSELARYDSFARQVLSDGREVTVCDFSPKWHAKTGTLLGTGQTVWYADNRVMRVRPRATAYAVYDSVTAQWSAWQRVEMPADAKFQNSGAGSVQRLDLENGDVLLPIYFKEQGKQQYSVTVCRCEFDGETLKYVEHGSELTVNVQRGLCEPSITRYAGRYFLTMRNDQRGYVSVSDDGLHFEPIRVWTFDDGSELGNYNTQQHWVTHSDGLYLVYTRRGADNDHVFRHRAPLFIARVDPKNMCVLRSTEQILVPERGARLGNFGVTDISPLETWVTVTEWMQPVGVEQHGSDNSIFVARLKWNQPNRLFGQ